MQVGDIIARKSYNKDITFKVVDLQKTETGIVCILKGLTLRILADSLVEDLELVSKDKANEIDLVFDRKITASIKKVLNSRLNANKKYRYPLVTKHTNENIKAGGFGRPGKVLHIDADSQYMNACLKVYKQLSIEAHGFLIAERDQRRSVVELIKNVRPDIVVITGHDGILKGTKDFLDLANYKNSMYFVDTVAEIRAYHPNYDDLVIFAGACQSCYEAILDAGANFASSPNRVLIHCFDPVFVCEKIAYTSFEKIVPIQEVIENTITGLKGIGGLQTRGKYREGFPKSLYS
ncbi:MAG: sporulation peptidase YabG [Clostridiaceae bacterium]|nr:sporulation peptidase YabG [Clostridiaceae bacterium]